MKIAFLSFEYPPDTAFGGIATYVQQAARMLALAGHHVEVFTAGEKTAPPANDEGVTVHRIPPLDRVAFGANILPVFSQRQRIVAFDVVESPEYFADGLPVRRAHPEVPHVVKLHTPSELLRKISSCRSSPIGFLRHNKYQLAWMVHVLRQERRLHRYVRYRPGPRRVADLENREREIAQSCDLVVSPSQSLASWAAQHWAVSRDRLQVVPYPYTPRDEILDLDATPNRWTVGFFGRMEYRKGIDALLDAIPLVLHRIPQAQFRFVGAIGTHPATRETYDRFLRRRLKRFLARIEIVGPRPLINMPQEYAQVDVCVFPSVWENFPNVCLEAMAAGRAIVGSREGGMMDMLEDGKHGLLASPQSPREIAAHLITLLEDPAARLRFGRSARERLLGAYCTDRILPELEASYRTAIALHASQHKHANPEVALAR